MQSFNLNLVPGSFQQVFNCSQGDIGRQLTAKLFDGSTEYAIPAGSTVKIKATKPSGFGFDESATFSGSTVTITTAETMTNEWGRFPAELVITKDGNVIGTANFLFNIEKNPHPDSTVDGDAEEVIPELTLLVERVEAAASSVLDMEVVATTLPAGSQASYSYDEDLNKATFGIPQGEAGAGAAGVVASAYSSSKTYKVGDYVIHNSNLYRCTTAITTAEAFTAAHWTQIVLADDVSDLKTDLDNIDEAIVKKAGAIEQTVNGNPIVIEDGGEDLLADNIIIKIEPIQSGSGEPSPDNRRALSGTDKVDFYKVGINVWNEDWEHGYYGDSSGTIVAFPSDTIIRSKPFPVEPNTEYRLLVDDTSYNGGFFIGMIEDLATMHGYGIGRGADQYKVVTTGADTHYMCFALKDTYGSTYKNDVSVNCPSSDTHYHKGTNNVYAEINLGQTVYGGELDLTSGKLTPLYELITYDGTQGELYDLPSTNGYFLYLGMKSGTLQDGKCDIAPTKKIDTPNGYGVRFGLGDTAMYLDQFKTELGVSTVAEFKTYCATNPIQFVQPIRNVSEIQLTPIEVLTALGYNKFKCNASTMDITYGVDTTAYMKQFEHLLPNIPEYFESQLDTAIETAKDNIFETGIGGDDFIFLTDVHWHTNSKHSPAMIKKIIDELNINKIVCGGDLIGGGAKADNIDLMVDCVSKFKDITRFYCLFGNHDDNSAGTAEANHFTKSESYALMQKQADFVMDYGSLCYFYFDNPTTKTRFICLDSYYIGTQLSDEQSAWLTTTLNDMPSGYHAIVFSHIMYDVTGYDYQVGVTPEDLFLTDFGSAVSTILDTFNTNNDDKKVEAVFAGHVHIDANFTTTGGIPIVITNCDSRQTLVDDGTGQADHAEGTIKEQCFDIVTVDYTTSTIKCVRVGRGSNRTITY